MAQVLIAEGCLVSGSDRYCDTGHDPEVARKLRSAGVRFFPQDGSGIAHSTRALVVSSAIENDNPEILAANRLNVPVVPRAQMLGSLVRDKCCVAVAGTSGKSTVTGMIGWILERLGADPVVVNGGILLNWRDENRVGNVRTRRETGRRRDAACPAGNREGNSREVWVIEADESDRSLLSFSPDWAVITSLSSDHFGPAETVELFRAFSRRVKVGLVGVLNDKDFFRNFAPELSATGSDFTYGNVRFRVNLPGHHNAENAMCAVVLCERLGFGLERIGGELGSFMGIQRRLETAGTVRGVTVVDDYAHNPAKIRAAWRAVAPYYRRVLGVWRPHGFGPLSMMMDGLTSAFSELCVGPDRIYVLPVYDAGGTADRTVQSHMLVERLRARGAAAVSVNHPAELVEMITGIAERGDVVLTMGARDPELAGLARNLLERLSCGA